MNKKTRTIIICAVILMLVGGIMMAIGLLNGAKTTLYWDSEKHRLVCVDEDEMYVTREKFSVDQFDKIDINVSRAKVKFVPADGYYVEYSVMSENKNPLTVQGGKLTFCDDTGRFFELNFGYVFNKHNRDEYLTIYYPKESELDSIVAELDMGNMEISGVYAKMADIELSMGNLDVTDSRVDMLSAELDMGSLEMKNTETGVFSADLSMGDITLLNSVVTGGMETELDMGSADISLAQIDSENRKIEYGYDLETDMGDVEVNEADQGNKYSQPGDVMLKISCDMGSIALNLY